MSRPKVESHARNPKLEASILEAPESPDAYLVYGDWLLEQGDSLAELVTVQATLAKLRGRAGKAKEKSALAKREKLLLKEAETRLGELSAYEHTWSFGFLESLILSNPSAKDYQAVLEAPVARFLRELDIEGLPSLSPYAGGTQPTLDLLARFGVPPALRKLALSPDNAGVELGRVPQELWPKLVSLRELTIKAADVDPGQIVLPKLETLALTTALTDEWVEALSKAECPLLQSVHLEAQDGENADTLAVTAERLRPLFANWAKAGTLRHLGLTEHGAGDELLECLLTTGLLKQLTSLDLSRTRMTDRGGRAVLQNAPSFEHLDSLNLSENDLTNPTSRALEKKLELIVDIEEQGERYDPIQE